MKVLSQAQLDFFLAEGYVIVSGVYSKEEVDKLRLFFKEKFETGFWKISEFNSPSIINDIYAHFPEMAEMIFKPGYVNAVMDIYGSNIICIPECCIHYNRFFDWHRDTTTLESTGKTEHRSGSNFMVQASIYLQDNSPHGGGLTLVPRSRQAIRDRFVTMYRGNFFHRIYHKLLKIFKRSAFHHIERSEYPVDVPTKAGDIVIFDNQLDHRATFLPGKNRKPQLSGIEKFAVFNTFCNNPVIASLFLESLKSPDEPYAHFLRQTTTATALSRRAGELGFSLCYSGSD